MYAGRPMVAVWALVACRIAKGRRGVCDGVERCVFAVGQMRVVDIRCGLTAPLTQCSSNKKVAEEVAAVAEGATEKREQEVR
jgi:hypothetical protein